MDLLVIKSLVTSALSYLVELLTKLKSNIMRTYVITFFKPLLVQVILFVLTCLIQFVGGEPTLSA